MSGSDVFVIAAFAFMFVCGVFLDLKPDKKE